MQTHKHTHLPALVEMCMHGKRQLVYHRHMSSSLRHREPVDRSHRESHETDVVPQAVCFSKAGVHHNQSDIQLLA